jgi:hypothetical protein
MAVNDQFHLPPVLTLQKRPTVSIYLYSETNMLHFLFSLLRINGLYMFRALLARRQEALHKRHLVYCVRVMSVGCTRNRVELVRQVMLETCRGP